MATYIVVHGAWHDGWCWERLTRLLAAAGHSVIAPDLPNIGEDALTVWTDYICDLVHDAQTEGDGPILLVGHSRAGTIISQVAERMPEAISRLIFIAAYLLPDGESCMAHALRDRTVGITPATYMSEDRRFVRLNREKARALLYSDCTVADADAAMARLRDEPVSGLATPVRLSAARFGTVARSYISTQEDRVVPLTQQQAMLEHWPCTMIPMSGGHFPMLTQPEALAAHLLALVRQRA